MIVGFNQHNASWQALLAWAREQNFADHAEKPDSVPFRIENILREKMDAWDGTRVEWAKGYIEGHYFVKQSKPELTRAEQLARGQVEMALAEKIGNALKEKFGE